MTGTSWSSRRFIADQPDELNQKIIVAWHRETGLALARFIAADGGTAIGIGESRLQPRYRRKGQKKWQIVGESLVGWI